MSKYGYLQLHNDKLQTVLGGSNGLLTEERWARWRPVAELHREKRCYLDKLLKFRKLNMLKEVSVIRIYGSIYRKSYMFLLTGSWYHGEGFDRKTSMENTSRYQVLSTLTYGPKIILDQELSTRQPFRKIIWGIPPIVTTTATVFYVDVICNTIQNQYISAEVQSELASQPNRHSITRWFPSVILGTHLNPASEVPAASTLLVSFVEFYSGTFEFFKRKFCQIT